MARDHWPVDKKDEAIALYLQGMKYKTITAETGVPQATLQEWLRQEGITPNRSPRSREPIEEGQLLERYERAQREIGRLEALLAEREATIAMLRAECDGDGSASTESAAS